MLYGKDYSKLNNDVYTTIRKHKKGNVGDIKKETYPKGSHYAKIIKVERKTLNSIDLETLQKDTDLEKRQEIYDLFESFYDKINFDKYRFYIYTMEKLKNA